VEWRGFGGMAKVPDGSPPSQGALISSSGLPSPQDADASFELGSINAWVALASSEGEGEWPDGWKGPGRRRDGAFRCVF
jgi:hypothetical protein